MEIGNFSSFFDSQIYQNCHSKWYKNVQRNLLVNLQPSIFSEIVSNHSSPVHTLGLDAVDSRYLLSGAINGSLSLFDIEKSSRTNTAKSAIHPRHTIPVSSSIISSIHWFPNDCGMFIASSFKGNVFLFDTNLMENILTFNFDSLVYNSQFSPHGNTNTLLAVSVDDGNLRLCDIVTGDYIHTIHAHKMACTCAEWNPVREYEIATAGKDGGVKCWDIRKMGSTPLLSLDWLRDDTFKRSKTGFIKDIKTKTNLIQAHPSEVMSMRYSSCGKYLITSGNDCKTRIWSSHSGSLLALDFNVGKLAKLPFRIELISNLLPGEDVFLLPVNDEIQLFPLLSGNGDPICKLTGHFDKVSAVACRSSTMEIISAARDSLILLWDSSSSRQAKDHEEDEEEELKRKRLNKSELYQESVSFITEHVEPKNKFIIPILSQYMRDARMDLPGDDRRPPQSSILQQRNQSSSSSRSMPPAMLVAPASAPKSSEVNWNLIDRLFAEDDPTNSNDFTPPPVEEHSQRTSAPNSSSTTALGKEDSQKFPERKGKRKPSTRDEIEKSLKKRGSNR